MTNTYRTHIELRWTDFDMLGHINNAKFIEIAQDARVKMWESASLPYGPKTSVVVRRLEVDYWLPVVPGSAPISVELSILKIGNSSFVVRHDVLDKDDATMARIDAVMVAFNLETNTSTPISDELRSGLERYLV